MMMLRVLTLPPVLVVWLLTLLSGPAWAQTDPRLNRSFFWIDSRTVEICPVADPETCSTATVWDIDPQNDHIIVRGRLALPERLFTEQEPLGLFVSGKAASRAWVNGELVGENGRPGDTRRSETVGRMDAVFYVPRSVLRPGNNAIELELSGHHSLIDLSSPVHMIGIGTYTDQTARIITDYGPSLMTFGAFLLGAIFFGVMALEAERRLLPALLAGLSLSTGGQLLSESARGLFAYDYPMHDVRLMSITAFAVLSGLLLNAYLIARFTTFSLRARLAILGGLFAGMSVMIAWQAGFDGKTGLSLMIALIAALGWCGWALWRGQTEARAFLPILGLTLAAMVWDPNRFLDFYIYVGLTTLLLLLLAQHALLLIEERKERLSETRRAGQLEVALDQARQREAPESLQLVSAGRVDYVATDRITQIKAAGDYVEICFESGDTRLYTAALSALEADLPPSFLRVHRSHIVNTAFVSALEREASGTGRLVLSDGTETPVSRRILPKVRNALAAA